MNGLPIFITLTDLHDKLEHDVNIFDVSTLEQIAKHKTVKEHITGDDGQPAVVSKTIIEEGVPQKGCRIFFKGSNRAMDVLESKLEVRSKMIQALENYCEGAEDSVKLGEGN